MFRDDYKRGYELNRVATREYFPDISSDITNIKSAATMNWFSS